jgi:DNA-binding MurR/RpiR family transcriptional regulator
MKDNCWILPGHIARTSTLTGNEKILYAYLLSNPDASTAPNTQSMAEACGVDKTTTLLAIKGLEAARLLKVKRTNAKKLKRMIEISVCNGRMSKPLRSKARR